MSYSAPASVRTSKRNREQPSACQSKPKVKHETEINRERERHAREMGREQEHQSREHRSRSREHHSHREHGREGHVHGQEHATSAHEHDRADQARRQEHRAREQERQLREQQEREHLVTEESHGRKRKLVKTHPPPSCLIIEAPSCSSKKRVVEEPEYSDTELDEDKSELVNRKKRRKASTEYCPICLEVFCKSDEKYFLNCGHCFHSLCVTQWLDVRRTCPTCRAAVTDWDDD